MLIDCCGHPWLHMEAPRDGPTSESEQQSRTLAYKTSSVLAVLLNAKGRNQACCTVPFAYITVLIPDPGGPEVTHGGTQ